MKTEKPPFISTGDEGSFARASILKRFPALVDGVLKDLPAGDPRLGLFLRLENELAAGAVTDPFEAEAGFGRLDAELFEPAELADWKEAIAAHRGLPWTASPFYFIEAYFYLRILAAWGYYDSGSIHRFEDPFRRQKEEELANPLASSEWRDTAAKFRPYLEGKKAPPEAIEDLVLLTLRGNRMDLSNKHIAAFGRSIVHDAGREDLLIDDSGILSEKVLSSGRLDFILDNAGTELVADLLLAAVYLVSVPGSRVVLHTKKAPILVSDAMTKDVAATVAALKKNSGFEVLGGILEGLGNGGRLVPKEHYFWNGPRSFDTLPETAAANFAGSDLILVKGDANFRRLLEDRRWPHSVKLAERTGHFPAPIAVLRMFKSEIAADIDEKTEKRAAALDSDWLFDGKWGVVQFVSR